MDRVPEPERMDDDAQARAYAEADFEEPHSRFIELLRASFPDLPSGGTALDLGCGPADIALRFARSFPGWCVDGVDAAPAMLRYGREAVEAAGFQDRVNLLEAHLPQGSALRQHYDLVFSNSLLHHLASPEVLWACVRRWAPEGAPVFAVDLERPESREQARELVEQYAAGEPELLRRDFFRSLLAAYRVDEVKQQLAEAGLAKLAVSRIGDRHLMVRGRR
jgi:cyclopropane fatty-acyl-phospholipid synthase-like methyltransferase